MEGKATSALRLVCALTLLALASVAQAQTNNVCDEPGESPDVIVGDLSGAARWGRVGDVTAFSVGTTSCNVGTCWLNWFGENTQHPVIGQNMYRLKDGRFEQIGQSWLKHGFLALSGTLCSSDCIPTSGDHLGVNCSDPYGAGLNGSQGGLGPKSDVNAATGQFPFPATDIDLLGDAIYKRLQVHNADLNPLLNTGATYFVEGQYVTRDDADAGNGANNASYSEVNVFESGGELDFSLVGTTEREKPAISAWIEGDPGIVSESLDIPGDGRFILASKVTALGNDYWHYEYAVHNLNSHLSAGSFRLAIPPDAHVTHVGFHDVDYHSGEPYDGTDWSSSVVRTSDTSTITWATDPFAENPNANALRWGTLYNFRFDANVSPSRGTLTLGLFRPGGPTEAPTALLLPDPCDKDGVCEPGEDCLNCADDCAAQGGGTGCCGDDTCDPGEDACSCSADCGPCLVPCATAAECDDGSFCNGVETCADDLCAPGPDPCPDEFCNEADGSCTECIVDTHCDDGLLCNGLETCSANVCVAGGGNPCPSGLCLEDDSLCAECVTDTHCDDGIFCNGVESCSDNDCFAGSTPCPGQQCVEQGQACVDCLMDAHCDDGIFCNGVESCVGNQCAGGTEPCPAGLLCDESIDDCVDCLEECDDGLFCNGVESCVDNACVAGQEPCSGGLCDDSLDACVECLVDQTCGDGVFCNGFDTCTAGACVFRGDPCPGQLCNEASDVCEGNVQVQAQMGRPLIGLTLAEQARFAAGETAFDRVFDETTGLGPVYNQTSCGGCHSNPRGGSGSTSVTLFGFDDGQGGGFDPLEQLGGMLHQTQTLSPECAETLPAEANVTTLRATSSTLGAGLIEAIADSAIEEWAINPPAGVSGRVHNVEAHEQPGVLRVGRFGWKSQMATVLSASADDARNEMGITNRLLPDESAPNGDQALLATCDAQPDPEDGPDGEGFDFIDRVTDFQRLLAAPPQTPRSGMSGGVWFNLVGCSKCHVGSFITADDPQLESSLRNKLIKPYSDFLLHDMGQTADFIGQGEAQPQEMRTAPLWGLRSRDRLWHDGRVSGGTFEERMLAVVALHDAPGSEAQAAAQGFAGLPQGTRDAVIRFLDSLGRAEFDHDGDGDVDQQDFEAFSACYHGPGGYDANDPCAVSDVDQNGTVDDDDYALFRAVYGPERFGGSVPDGAGVPGMPLRLSKAAGGEITLSWGASCRPEDTDYEIYEGPLGQFEQHVSRYCSTDGETTRTFAPAAGASFYLVVPSNGIREGSYGTDGAGNPRPPRSGFACRAQTVNACE